MSKRLDFSSRSTEELIEISAMVRKCGLKFEGFVLVPDDLLADQKFSAMPLEARGAHLTLMACAWRSEISCSVSEADFDVVIMQAVNEPLTRKWLEMAWEKHGSRWWQRGLLKTMLQAATANAKKAWGRGDRAALAVLFEQIGIADPGSNSHPSLADESSKSQPGVEVQSSTELELESRTLNPKKKSGNQDIQDISGPTDPHPPASGRARTDDIDRVLDAYDFGQRTWIDYQLDQGHRRKFSPVARNPQGTQGEKNRKRVAGLLKDHDVEVLCLAARNIILVAHNRGANDRNRQYMALSVALNENLAERAGIWDGPDEELAAELRRSIARAEHAERKRNGRGGIVASTDPDAYTGPGAALLFPVLSPEAAATIAWSREQDRLEGRDPDAFH